MPTELRLRQMESEGGERAVIKEYHVSNFGNLLYHGNRPVVPYLETTAASPSSGDADPVFVIGLLGIDVKRESNRGNDKKCYCSCHGGGTSLVFIVGLLDVDNQRGGNRGNRATSHGCSKVQLSLLQWQGGSGSGAGQIVVGLLGVEVEDIRGSRHQGATGAQNLHVLWEGDWWDGFSDRCAGSSQMVSHFLLG